MARFRIILATLLFTLVCAIHSHNQSGTSFERVNSYLIERILFYNQGQNYTYSDVRKINQLIRISEYEFGIRAIDLIALISHESQFNKYATGRNKTSKDFGYTQQNSCCIKTRYKEASVVLDRYNIKYDITDKYDTSLNIISATMFLWDIKMKLTRKEQYTPFRMYATYNTGKAFPKGKKYRAAVRYYNSIKKIKSSILARAIDFDRK